MVSHSAVLLCALVTALSAASRDVASFNFHAAKAGQKFEIVTADQVYRGELVDRATGECKVVASTDGASFGAPRTVYLLGATAGPAEKQMLVIMREVKVGWKLELGVDDLDVGHRMLTNQVKAIRLVD